MPVFMGGRGHRFGQIDPLGPPLRPFRGVKCAGFAARAEIGLSRIAHSQFIDGKFLEEMRWFGSEIDVDAEA